MSSIDVIDVLRAKAEPGRYPVNLRITVPFLPRPFFVTLIIGPERRKIEVRPRVYWFNDSDYHGVEADPFFRYSVRVDGFFRPEFLQRLRRSMAF